MKRIKLLRNVAIRGMGYPEGAEIDVEDNDANILVAMKKAKVVVPPAPAPVLVSAPEEAPEVKQEPAPADDAGAETDEAAVSVETTSQSTQRVSQNHSKRQK